MRGRALEGAEHIVAAGLAGQELVEERDGFGRGHRGEWRVKRKT